MTYPVLLYIFFAYQDNPGPASKCALGDRAGVPGPLPGQALSSPLHGNAWEASGLILQICYQSD